MSDSLFLEDLRKLRSQLTGIEPFDLTRARPLIVAALDRLIHDLTHELLKKHGYEPVDIAVKDSR